MFGTLSVGDTLASTVQSIAEFGEENLAEYTLLQLRDHNRIVMEMLGSFVYRTSEKQLLYGGADAFVMQEVDEFGTPNPQKTVPGNAVGFPLRKFAGAVQWTRDYFMNATVEEFANQVNNILDGDVRNIQSVIRKAIFSPSNYSWNDRYVRKLNVAFPLAVKALANADGMPIAPDPYGNAFNASSHTHYLVCATPGSPILADVIATIETVIEHFAEGAPVLYINRAQEALLRGLTGFAPIFDARVTPATTLTVGQGSLDQNLLQDRMIGFLDGAEVWTKPWVPAAYMIAWQRGVIPPVALRVPDGRVRPDGFAPGDLTLAFDNEIYPLRARGWERYIGAGAYNRVAMSVLDCTNASYTTPSGL